jgi:hypothetical protein
LPVLHGLLCLLPPLLLAIPLVARRYPGERLLLSLGSEKRRARWPRPHSSTRSRRPAVHRPVRGGRLIGACLAVRPPPLALLAS